jgi:hypothetical protein
MFERIYQRFEEELSGVNAKNIAAHIFPFDRSCSFSGSSDLSGETKLSIGKQQSPSDGSCQNCGNQKLCA